MESVPAKDTAAPAKARPLTTVLTSTEIDAYAKIVQHSGTPVLSWALSWRMHQSPLMSMRLSMAVP